MSRGGQERGRQENELPPAPLSVEVALRPPLTEICTVEQMIAERPATDQTEATSDISPEIAEQIVHQFMDRQ